MNRAAAILALTLPVASAAPLAAQWPTGVKLTGYVEASYTSSSQAVGDGVVGRLYDRFNDQYMLNALTLAFEKAHDPAKRSVGFRAEVLFGQNAAVVQSAGLALGPQGDVPHFYATFNLPTKNGNGVQFKVGRVPTLMGLEVIETTSNPNCSEGNQFIYVENFTNTGLSIETKFSPKLDAQLRVFNGWDLVNDNNRGKSFMGRVGIYPDANTSVALLAFVGPEQAGNASNNRSGGEVLVWRKFGKTSLWLQGDLGTEDPGANWTALGVWLARDLNATTNLALRADYLNDQDGARTSGVLGFPTNTGQELTTVTATLNIRAWPDALVRPEVRYDHSNLVAFDGERAQVTFALSVAYLF
jgi:hypothetical protein